MNAVQAYIPGADLACNTATCDQVSFSKYAFIGSVPIALIGLAYHLLQSVLIALNRTMPAFVLAIVGSCCSLYLLYTMRFLIGAMCANCTVSAIACGLILLMVPQAIGGGPKALSQVKLQMGAIGGTVLLLCGRLMLSSGSEIISALPNQSEVQRMVASRISNMSQEGEDPTSAVVYDLGCSKCRYEIVRLDDMCQRGYRINAKFLAFPSKANSPTFIVQGAVARTKSYPLLIRACRLLTDHPLRTQVESKAFLEEVGVPYTLPGQTTIKESDVLRRAFSRVGISGTPALLRKINGIWYRVRYISAERI